MLQSAAGELWSAIATHLPKRTDNEIKNYWNTHLKKRLAKMGIDPVTHKPKGDTLGCQSKSAANLSHMAQWESARLEAEARLARESKLRSASSGLHQHHSLPLGSSVTCSSSSSSSATTVDHDRPGVDILQSWHPPGIWSKSLNNPQGVDLESPTSTLTISAGLMDDNHPTMCQQPLDAQDIESEEVEWKCLFGKQPTRMDNFTSLIISMDPTTSAWLSDSSNVGNVTSDTGEDLDVAGFTGMLLDNSSEARGGESNNAEEHSSCADVDEENKRYWDSILNLVNSSSPSDSPPSPSPSPPVF
ncbi:hypothetical protein J5N97_006637 [Dioscorea zingiberensis]|uniref:Uncharacterized protein n=1 Tax=Dioscorea zingiberensis TaxID=325984 RepID=A0A9D5DAF1_9LILI|nr:hypothetical protein J5N97_006637 [Dioscorea zingiberensis]